MKGRASLLIILLISLLRTAAWDGYINGSKLAGQGVYIYKAWITYSGGENDIQTGDVTFLH